MNYCNTTTPQSLKLLPCPLCNALKKLNCTPKPSVLHTKTYFMEAKNFFNANKMLSVIYVSILSKNFTYFLILFLLFS